MSLDVSLRLVEDLTQVAQGSAAQLARLGAEIVSCRACPRLVAWREQVAAYKRAAFADQEYWGRPVPGFGDPAARLVVVGLAPAAHGANRTGRVFTGDRSGDWLFRALWKAGWANQPTSIGIDDGLALDGAWVTAAVRCAPPANRPTPAERDSCAPYLAQELTALSQATVIVVLGAFAHQLVSQMLGLRPRPPFGHGAEVPAALGPAPQSGAPRRPVTLICSYHPSQQNTFTGTLTEAAFDRVFARARELGA